MPSPPLADTRLSGTRLRLARWGWSLLMLIFCGFYLAAVLAYYVQFHGFQQGAYAHLLAMPAVVSGYDTFGSLYLLLTGPYATLNITLITCFSPFWIAVSLVIFWRRSDDWMALYIALLLVMLVTSLSPAFSVLSRIVGLASPLGVCITLLQLLSFSSIIFFFALFPDGRFVPGWTRWMTLAYLAWQVPLCLPSTSPFSLVHWPPLLLASLLLCMILACGFAQLYRYRCVSTVIQRQQTKWVVFGMLIGTLFDAANLLPPLIWPAFSQSGSAQALYAILSEVTFPLVLLLVPITIGVAVLRYRLWDIDLLINRTLVYGLLTASIIGLYLLVVVGLGTLFSVLGNLLLSLLATGLVAVLVQPLRQRLQRAVNHLMFGERDEPYRVLAQLGRRLEATLAIDSLLPTMVQTVAQALKLPSVAITSKQQGEDILVASTGEASREARARVPLVAQSEHVGDLWLSARAPGELLTPADLHLLHDLAPQIAVAVQAVRLTAELRHLTTDLQQSRIRLVTAREEERRRLRRDLHDGLGPTLASLTFKIDAARNLLTRDSERANRLLESVRQQAQEAITDIRRLVYDLRPPTLDELGLLSALREQAASYQHQGLQILIEAPECLPALPAAVEVAAYRIAQEALINVVRHAEAQQCLVRLRLRDHVLTLQITDDGKGIAPEHHIGVGWLSMQERAVELGGRCTITDVSCGGTTIQISLPLGMTEDSSPTPPSATTP
ncbi:MAG TPA: GAF domain-containing sensor histidine kinase [Ktedonobacteraceae bacterium]|nr:GAF domain-containing sensor histidine kinase [Ktedonobacteraceae bacterium]